MGDKCSPSRLGRLAGKTVCYNVLRTMIGVVQLLATEADFETRRSAALLREQLGAGFFCDLRTIGRGGTYRDPAHALLRLRRDIPADAIIHAWGAPSLPAGVMAGQRRVVFSPGSAPHRTTAHWLRAAMGCREMHVVCPTATQRKMLVTRGVPVDRCHLIRPGVEFSRVRRRRDPALRAALGIDDDDLAILAVGESTRNAAHRDALWASSILHTLDPRFKLILWGEGPHVRTVTQLAGKLRQREMLAHARRRLRRRVEFEALLPAADLVLCTAIGPVATLPLAITMAAALPIVSTVTYTVSELLEDHHNALMEGTGLPRLMAQRVLDLKLDSSLEWTLADRARTEAFDYFSATRFLNQYRTLYQQIAEGGKVDLPETVPGAGSRFIGRA